MSEEKLEEVTELLKAISKGVSVNVSGSILHELHLILEELKTIGEELEKVRAEIGKIRHSAEKIEEKYRWGIPRR